MDAMTQDMADHRDASTSRAGSSAAGWALAVLTAISVCNWIDRTIMSILLEPIKAEFHVSDTMMGLLTGLGFTLFYAIASLPLAHMADRRSRRDVLALFLVLWSGMTMVAGLVRTFAMLLAARAGVAISESAGSPTSQSMIVDYFEPRRRPLALSIYMSSVYMGTTLSTMLGGIIAFRFGWRAAMIAVAVPGFLLALVLVTTVREPPRGRFDPATTRRHYRFGEAIRMLFADRACALTIVGIAVASIVSGATLGWTPAFVGRIHHLDLKQLGLTLGLVKGVTGIAGVVGGGWIAGRGAAGGVRRQLLLCAGAVALSIPFFLGFTLAPGLAASLICVAIFQVLATVPLGVTFAVVHALSAPGMRTLAAAVASFGTALTGGIGPLYIGILNDAFARTHGVEAIRYAMTLLTPFIMLTALLYWLGARAASRQTGAERAADVA